MRAVQRLQGSRTVSAFFAETDPSNYRKLNAVVSEYAASGLSATALSGSAEEHLDTVVAAARGGPLFLFLDPCGALLPFLRLARVIGAERRDALVFLTRSQYGIWVFADALGKARQDWLRATGRLDDDSDAQPALPGMSRSEDMQQLIDSEKARAQEIIEDNLRCLLRPGPFKLVNQARQVFGDAYGIATDAAVSAAVRALEASRQLVTIQPSTRIRDRVIGPLKRPAPPGAASGSRYSRPAHGHHPSGSARPIA